jgi:hypothetical protein
MSKKIASGLLIIFAYVIPMAAGIIAGFPEAGWLFVPMLISLGVWAYGEYFTPLWSAIFLLLLGIIVAVIVGLTGNGWFLWASFVILIAHIIFDTSGIFD